MKTPFPPEKSAVQEISSTKLQDALASSKLAVVSLKAEWCGFCPAIKPTIEEIAKETKGAVGVYRIEYDDAAQKALDKAGAGEIMGLPTTLFYRNGKLVGKTVGATPAKVKAELAKLLKSKA